MGKMPEKKTMIAQNLLAFDDLIRESGITITELDPLSVSRLLRSFSFLEDKRQKHKIIYPIQSLFLIVMLAKLSHSGHNCCEIAGFAKSHKDALTASGALKSGRTPSHDTIQRFIENLDTKWIRSILIKFKEFYSEIQRIVSDPKQYTHIAVDGKEFRGSGRGKNTRNPRRNTATLNIYDSSSDVCLYSITIDEKTNEIPIAQKKLIQLDLRNTIVTADALHCQKDTAEIIRKRRGDYVLCAKDNQEGLKEDIKSSFEKKRPKQHEPVFFNRNNRKFWVIKLEKGYIGEDWIAQRLYIKMISSATGKEAEPMYFITSISDMTAAIEAIEVRWTVENSLHKNKDFYCSEDRFTSTSTKAIESMAYLNNLTVAMARMAQIILQEPRLKTVYQQFAANPIEMFQKIMEIVYHQDKFLSLLRERLKSAKAS